MASEVLWIEVSSGRVFRVPGEEPLPMGEAVVRNLKGERLEVDLEALAEFEVPREEAFRQLRGDLGSLLGSLGEGLREEAEKLEPTVRDLGDRLRENVNQAQVAEALDGLGDRLKHWADALRSGTDGKARTSPSTQQGPDRKLCPACFALIVGPGLCISCEFDLDQEEPVTMSPSEVAEAERRDCLACGTPILESARRCAACGAHQERGT